MICLNSFKNVVCETASEKNTIIFERKEFRPNNDFIVFYRRRLENKTFYYQPRSTNILVKCSTAQVCSSEQCVHVNIFKTVFIMNIYNFSKNTPYKYYYIIIKRHVL